MSLVSAISNSKIMTSIANAYRKDPAKAISYAAITSIAVKDGVGCAMYVTQSLNNKKIPDERRKFVAALDLTNGILMILTQIGMFFAMKKVNEALFSKVFNSSFSNEAKKSIVTKFRMLQKKAGVNPSRKNDLLEKINKIEKGAAESLKFVTELAAATILGKRVIVPFIATPLAAKVKKQMDKRDAEKHPELAVNAQPEDVKNNNLTLGANLDVKSIATSGGETNLLEKYKQANNA